MNGRKYFPDSRATQKKTNSQRSSFQFNFFLLAGILLVGVFVFKSLIQSPQPMDSAPTAAALEPKEPIRHELVVAHESVPVPVVAEPAVEPASTPRSANELMAELIDLSGIHGTLTAEQAARFKQVLAQLIQSGSASVPAIQEFLKKNADFHYIDIAGGEQLGFPTLRATLFDALKQIGGPEAQTSMLQTLQGTGNPSEVLELAKDLEVMAPGMYSDDIQKSARDALSAALTNQNNTNIEIGPLFRLVQIYGGNTIDDSVRGDAGGFYNAIAAANLPNAQGLPSLVQMAQNSSGGSQSIATEMIAQLAGQNSVALDALTQMAQKGQIPNSVWMKVAPILGGDQYQLNTSAPSGANSPSGSTEQNYSVVNNATTPDQINQRIAMIDGFLGYVPEDSAGANALRHERDVLSGKLNK